MSIVAKLYIDDKTFNILKFNVNFNQKSSNNGLPSSKPTGGLFSIVFETTKETLFYEWMVGNNTMKNLKIVLSPSTLTSKSRTIELFDVYCLKHEENFDGINNKPMMTYIQVSPAIMVQDGVKIFEWYWKVTDLNTDVEDTVIDNSEPELVSYHIEDLENNRIEEKNIKENQEIYLVINSLNTQGEISDIDLENKNIDYEYNGQWMKDDIIRDIVLNDTFTKVKLKAVKQKED